MPGLQTTTGFLNSAFGKDRIEELAESRDLFAPGKALTEGIKFIPKEQTPLHRALVPYIEGLPGSFQEMLRSMIYYALSTKPPTQITFAWTPGYDSELYIWQAPDTRITRGGITVLLKSRYPSDTHPVSGRASAQRRRAG